MSLILVISILIRLLAFGWSIVLLRRTSDWRMAFLAIMLALMALRQMLALWTTRESWTLVVTGQVTELPGLVVSIMAFLSIFFLERILWEYKQSEETRQVLEAELRHSHKMEAVGSLAAGVAHEYNNITAVIRTNTELILTKSSDELPKRLLQPIRDIERASARAFDLTNQLLSFSRQRKRLTVFDVNSVVVNNERMLNRLIGANIQLRSVLSPAPALVCADEGEIEQAIVNMVVNARDAMSTGGTITIETREVTLESIDIPRGCDAASFVRLSIADDGCGMSPDTMDRIFEPFFTTKSVGEGTGLGLSTVYADIEKNGGFTTVESREGEGTVFYVHLPKAYGLVVCEDSEKECVSTGPLGGNETVLVCDDEDLVLSSMSALLESVGYSVITANGAQNALAMVAAHAEEISLLLTDLTMPEMDGFELAREISRNYPDIKILCSSGYTADRVQFGRGSDDFAFIEKGVSSNATLQRIREILDDTT